MEAQEHWRVASTAPAEIVVREDGDFELVSVDYDASEVIWDAVTYPDHPFECASCCAPIYHVQDPKGVQG